MRLAHRLLAGAAALGIALSGPPAHAWKPKTHIYLAEEVLRDALDNGKVTLYETDHASGKILGTLGEFEVDPKILAALRAAPAQYRAGVLGPDAYPDILTGQQIIHPDEALAHDGSASGTDAWMAYLWQRGFATNSDQKIQAFTLGYLTHAAGDVFAHTFVNHFAGGEFMLTPDPTNAVKHLVLEGYIGKRTPETKSAFASRVRTGGGPRNGRKRDDLGLDPDAGADPIVYEQVNMPVTQANTSIAGVEDFIYREMTYAPPGSLLEQKLLKGGGTSRSIPYVYSLLRNGLQRQVDEYERVRMSKTGPDRLAYAALNGPAAEYKKAWIKDIDAGLAALPAVSHKVATAIVYNEQGTSMDAAEAAMKQYVVDHMASMSGVPDGVVATAKFVADVIEAISPSFLSDAISALMKEPIDALVKGTTGKTAAEWKSYLKNPEAHFDEIMNRRGGGHGGEVDHPITLADFNRDHLKIADPGFQNPSLKWKIEELPPAFNTVQLTKMLMLGDAGMGQLAGALQAKGAPMGAQPGQFRNHMLGWVRSLDAGNQWQGRKGRKPGPSPLPAFAKGGNAAAYYKLFLTQTGEQPIADAGTHGSNPAPADPQPRQPAPQDLRPWVDTWETTYGTVKLALSPDGVLSGRLMLVDPATGLSQESDRLELRAGASPGALVGTSKYAAHVGEVSMTLSAGGDSFTATTRMAGASNPSAWTGRRSRLRQGPPAPAPAPAPIDASLPKGRVTPLSVQVIGALPSAEVKAFTAKAGAIIEKVLATPTLHKPRGFSITRSLTIDSPPPEQPQSNPFVGRATMIPQTIDLSHGAQPDADGAYMGRLEGPTFQIRFNNLTALYANNSGGGMSDPRYLPMKMTRIQGFPVFQVGVRQVILIAKPGRLPYVPMTKGEYLDRLAREVPNDTRIAPTRAAMTPQDHAAPACESARLRDLFGDCSKSDATYLVRLNPDYFDKGARKGAIQLVAISTPIPGGHGHKILEPKLKAAASELDLKSIQAMLD